MAKVPQIHGAMLEEIVLLLLAQAGYRQILVGEEGTSLGTAGLEVEGRGSGRASRLGCQAVEH
jgi:hypothetical protein